MGRRLLSRVRGNPPERLQSVLEIYRKTDPMREITPYIEQQSLPSVNLMTHPFQAGDTVEWRAGSGTTQGTIQKKITTSTTIDGQTITASQDDPRYLVKNEQTGTVTGHKPETLTLVDSGSQQTAHPSSRTESADEDSLHPGDSVEWHTSQGTTHGTVKEKLTQPTQIKGHKVKASKEHPEYLVESDQTGKPAAHKPESLKKK